MGNDKDKAGKHDDQRDGEGQANPSNWSNYGDGGDDDNKHKKQDD
ncbi:hypothetical protein AB5J62_12415 [Amycolatopsis sp. cg5]